MSQPHVPQVENLPLPASLPAPSTRTTSLKCGTYEVDAWREEIGALPPERKARIWKSIALRARDKHARLNLSVRGARKTRGARSRRRASHSSSPQKAARSEDGDPDGGRDEPAKTKFEQIVILVPTRNGKLAARGELVFASTLPIRQTCPATCPLRDNGCSSQRGPGGHVARLEENAERFGVDSLDLAREEARLIRREARKLRRKAKADGPPPPLRLHVSGDAATIEAANVLADACDEWPGIVWTYTHAWRFVPREAWGSVSVFASVETPADIRLAGDRGYAPALTVPQFPADKRPWREAGMLFIPCPAEVHLKEQKLREANVAAGLVPAKIPDRPRTCLQCGLCFNSEGLRERGIGIAFETHGSGKLIAAKALVRARATANGAIMHDLGASTPTAIALGAEGGHAP